MIVSYIFRFVEKAKATNNLKMNGKGVKNSMANDDDNNDGNGQLVLDSRTQNKKALNV